MVHIHNKAAFLAVLGLFNASQVIADESKDKTELSKKSANYFVELYAKTCMVHAEDLTVLNKRFKDAKVPKLSKDKAKNFLEKKSGTVWVIPNVYGDFLVSIDKKQNCTVYSRFLNINQVERAFIAQLESSIAPILHHKLQDETLQTKAGPKHFIRYVLTNTDNNSKRNYLLTTTKADNVEIQIKASVSEVLN